MHTPWDPSRLHAPGGHPSLGLALLVLPSGWLLMCRALRAMAVCGPKMQPSPYVALEKGPQWLLEVQAEAEARNATNAPVEA